MESLVEQLLHTCLGVFGCGCLDEEFWRARARRRASLAGDTRLLHPQPQAALRDDLVERLLHSTPPEPGWPSIDGDGGGSQLQHAGSSGSEEMFRSGSFNTKVSVLRSQSPFYRLQEPAGPPAAAAAAAGSSGGGSGSGGGSAGGGGGSGSGSGGGGGRVSIEMKPASTNVLLGQQHLESRGKFLPAHPVQHPTAPVRRGPSPGAQAQQLPPQQLAAG